MTPEPFYFPLGSDLFRSSPWTRGPWSDEHQHGGPPTALVGRALERVADPETWFPSRVGVDLFRPVPVDVLRTRVEVITEGRTVLKAEGYLYDRQDHLLLRCRGTFVRRRFDFVLAPPPPREPPPPLPADNNRFEFSFFRNPVGYHRAMEGHITEGVWGQGPVSAWMRMLVPLVVGEEPSPWQRVLVAADSTSGLAPPVDVRSYTFINPDLNVALFRPLVGEYLGFRARADSGPRGPGLTRAVLFDQEGSVGLASQALVVVPRE